MTSYQPVTGIKRKKSADFANLDFHSKSQLGVVI